MPDHFQELDGHVNIGRLNRDVGRLSNLAALAQLAETLYYEGHANLGDLVQMVHSELYDCKTGVSGFPSDELLNE